MAQYRNFDIEMTIVPDAAGQYEAAFIIHESPSGKAAGSDASEQGAQTEGARRDNGNPAGQGGKSQGGQQAQKGDARSGRYAFPPVGSYLTPDDAREQTEAWARKWIDANFSTGIQ